MRTFDSRVFWLVLTIGLVCSLPSVQAATCTDGGYATIVSKLTTNQGCELGSTAADSVAQVNTDQIFGFDNWKLVDIGLTRVGTDKVGTWSINSDAWDSYKQIMLVFTQGGLQSPPNYVAYLLMPTLVAGTYASPFVNKNDITKVVGFDTLRAYATPLPGALPLFGSVVGLVTLLRWRKRRVSMHA
jgi:hypothetical protein